MSSELECDGKLLPNDVEQAALGNIQSVIENDNLIKNQDKGEYESNSQSFPILEVSEDDCQTESDKLENLIDETVLKKMAKLRFGGLFSHKEEGEDCTTHSASDQLPEDSLAGTNSPDSIGNENDDKGNSLSDEEECFIPPNDELADKIVKQVESYFTDFNIMKDSFLLKHVRRNKEGYISLKLVASFRRVKTLAKDWRVVRYSLERSKKLQLNAENTKIRRIEPVPQFEETSCAKTVIVFNLPSECKTSEDINEKMSTYGDVATVTVVTPGSDVPDVCTKRCLSFYDDLANKTFALVEFKTYAAALVAMKVNENTSENELKIVPLLSDVYKNKAKLASPKSDSKSPKRNNSGKRRQRRNRNRVDEIKSSESPASSPDSLGGRLYSPNSRRSPTVEHERDSKYSFPPQRLSKPSSQNSSPVGKFDNFQRSGRPKSTTNLGGDNNLDYSWGAKRYAARNGNNNYQSNNYRLPENVIRFPRGPDGTSGFAKERVNHPESPAVATTDITDVIKNFIANH